MSGERGIISSLCKAMDTGTHLGGETAVEDVRVAAQEREDLVGNLRAGRLSGVGE